jgi:DNA-binding NtrC family response regulator
VERAGEGRSLRPELEFVFRTLVDLRVDMDDLRREFEAYRRGARLAVGGPQERAEAEIQDVSFVEAAPGPPSPPASALGPAPTPAPPPPDGGGVVVYRAGMTMEDLEREAIRAVLESVEGNRRKAAELLGIGERTLYRKLARYDLES